MGDLRWRITYFDVRGRVDPARMILEAKKQPYEFVPIQLTEWQEAKPKYQDLTPFGQLPLLEVLNGEEVTFRLTQSLAISRYLAAIFNMDCGKLSSEKKATHDEVCELVQQVIVEIGKLFWDEDYDNLKETQTPLFTQSLQNLNKFYLKVRGTSNSPLLFGDELTMADIYLAFLLEQYPITFPNLFTESTYPELFTFYNHVFNSSSINDYVTSERRPKSYTVAMASFAGKGEDCVQWKK